MNLTTKKTLEIIRTGLFNKKSLANELGISRPTLDTRLSREGIWKKLEVKWIDHLHNKNVVN